MATTKRLQLHEVRTGDRVRIEDFDGTVSWVRVEDVQISYTSQGPDVVTVAFADDRTWRSYPPDMKVSVR